MFIGIASEDEDRAADAGDVVDRAQIGGAAAEAHWQLKGQQRGQRPRERAEAYRDAVADRFGDRWVDGLEDEHVKGAGRERCGLGGLSTR